ncbi:MAG: hypothetical protein Q7V63_09840 [Gammaproteobacteria bacterium]|nr:hypothetical protein [Gammaproteobacteria bacterium]
MSLEALQNIFQDQITQYGYIKIDAATLKAAELTPVNDFDGLIQDYLLLEAPSPLTVKTQTVPPPKEDALIVSGSAKLLNLDCNVVLTFTIDMNGITQLLLSTDLPKDWVFTRSFPDLSGYPVDKLNFQTGSDVPYPSYLFSTRDLASYSWNNQTLSLKQGLNFASYLLLTAPLDKISLFVENINLNAPVFFSGSINPTDMAEPNSDLYPIMDLKSPNLGVANVQGFEVQDSYVWFAVNPMPQPEYISPQEPESDTESAGTAFEIYLYFTVDLQIGKNLYPFRTPLLEDSSTFVFGLMPGVYQVSSTDIDSLTKSVFKAYIPEVIKKLFGEMIALKGFMATYYIPDKTVSLPLSLTAAIGTAEPWVIGDFTIEDITFCYTLAYPFTENVKTRAYFTAVFRFYSDDPDDPNDPNDPNDPDVLFPGYFEVEMLKEGEGLSVSASYNGDVDLGKIIRVMSDDTVKIPEELVQITFSNFGVGFSSSGSGKAYNFYGIAEADFDLKLLGAGKVQSSFKVDVDWLADGSISYLVNGGLKLGNAYFKATYDCTDGKKTLVAEWTALNKKYLGINTLAEVLQLPGFSVPESVDLNLKHAMIYYQFDKKTMVLEADSATYGSAVFISQNVAPVNAIPEQWEYVFVFQFNTKGLSIDSLPLFGKLSAGQTIALDVLQVTGASNVITATEMKTQGWQALADIVTQYNSQAPHFILPPSMDYPGSAITAKAHIGTVLTFELFLALSTSNSTPPEKQSLQYTDSKSVLAASDTSNTAFNPMTIWFKVQNSLGPIYLNRIGFAYQNDKFCILLDAALELTSLRMDVMGFGMSVPLLNLADESKYEFTIQGLGLDFAQPPLEISGALLRMPDKGGQMNFDGEAILSMPDLKVLGLGSYSTMAGSNDCSMFIIAMLNKALGGTPYFYVTGMCAGFGYNRALVIPVQSNVQNFPLVAGLTNPTAIGGTNPTPAQALATLEEWTPVRQGEYWFAVGVQGTTFEILNTNALFIVEFGKETIISIIGIATLKQPQTGSSFVYAALDIIASFKPDEGEILITAGLAPGAYILTPDAHLKGGFAFASWFGNSPYSGDFVFTIGGYNQYFQAPAHYPTVDRLAIDWKVMDGLTFTGSAYFAIVPGCMMAGNDLAMAYHLGGLKVWLKSRTDIWLYWKPFYFLADVSVSVGVSLRIKVMCVTTTLSVEVSSTMHMWGPEMGGSVYVDWCILSFTIGFGATKSPPPNTISWIEFQDMLPSKPPATPSKTQLTTLADDKPPKAYLYVNINEGLINSIALTEGEHWLVRADEFKFNTTSALPATTITVSTFDASNTYSQTGQQVGMNRVAGGVAASDYRCPQTISVMRMTEQQIEEIRNQIATISAQYSANLSTTIEEVDTIDKSWNFEVAEKNLPTAMWSTGDPNANQDPNNPQTVSATVGVTINPKPPLCDNGTPAMSIQAIFEPLVINKDDEDGLSIDENATAEAIIMQMGADSFVDIRKINDPITVVPKRTEVYDYLSLLGMAGLANGSLAEMAADPGAAFADEPLLGSTSNEES